MSQFAVSGLYYYPVKSLAGLSLQACEIDKLGIIGDRRWMVVDDEGLFITQRKYPQMALIKPHICENGILKLQHDQYGEIVVPQAQLHVKKVVVWKSMVRAYHCDTAVDNWLSQILQRRCQLVYFSEQSRRSIDVKHAEANEQVAFADGFPLLITTQASLESLNEQLSKPVPMARFRPNVVVSGNQPFEEHQWKSLYDNDGGTIDLVKPCARCIMTTIDHEKGVRDGFEPFRTLQSFHQMDGKPIFGVNAICRSRMRLHVGQEIHIAKL